MTDRPPDVSRLREVPLFSELGDEELEQVAPWFEARSASVGTTLAAQGASGYTFFLIVEGQADVLRDGVLLETLGPGDFFGEMAILGGGRRNATVTASSPVELLVLFGTEFRTLEQQFPDAARRIRAKVEERAARASQASS